MKSLVIYFSHTGENYFDGNIQNITKGNTEIVSEFIQELTGADLFKIETTKDYPFNYKECCDVAIEEKRTGERPNLKQYLDNIDNYDCIYIGSPIWWGTMPCALISQLERLNFKGKKVMPFTTHEGSGLGEVVNDIKKICVGANINSGLAIKGSNAKNCKLNLEKWILN